LYSCHSRKGFECVWKLRQRKEEDLQSSQKADGTNLELFYQRPKRMGSIFLAAENATALNYVPNLITIGRFQLFKSGIGEFAALVGNFLS